MTRRRTYTKVVKRNRIRADYAKGMGDVTFKGFQCLSSECQEFIFVRKDEIGLDFEIVCPTCGYIMRSGDETLFFEYELTDLASESIVEQGSFTVLHDDYVQEAQEYKYCVLCSTLKPLSLFDRHHRRKSGHQSECRLCKAVYNSIKNQTRLTDQHREAAQKRRMYLDLSGGEKIDSNEIHRRFKYQCFKCKRDLREVEAKERPLDHTLPASFLWPLTSENATLLCREHNGEKSGKWPSEYYSDSELKELAVLTGIPYETLAGPPHYNPEAIERLQNPVHVDQLLGKYAAYMPEIIKLRNVILEQEDFDFFEFSESISPAWVQEANREYQRVICQKNVSSEEADTDEM